ncbi:phasin family protein [Acuticoccus mangrovi]|uniref:TIGR01841 family phasin n=1 Tax=Acuticoccus mangrovi TaxID=2796142 RepID=A0A934IS07_9HYPH|nr:TIGR01841 family phasin [Acuticoccus mangrovi]MBJ3777605.1 TIGR01841 family phasin [Acuticoccus mangrovi]
MSTNENIPNPDAAIEQGFQAAQMATNDFASVIPGAEGSNMVRELAEQSIASARQMYETARNAAEEATDMMEDTYEHARKSFTEMNLKLIDQAQANTDRVFAFAKEVASAKTVSEAVELQTKFVREQFEAFAGQAREMQETAQKLATETTGPMKEAWERATQKFNT